MLEKINTIIWIRPGRTGNIGLFLGTGLRPLEENVRCEDGVVPFEVPPEREQGRLRSAVLYNIKSIIKSTFPIVQRSELLCFSTVLNQLSAGERKSDVDSAIILCSFEHLGRFAPVRNSGCVAPAGQRRPAAECAARRESGPCVRLAAAGCGGVK